MEIDLGLLLVGVLVTIFVVTGLVALVILARGGARTAYSSRQALGMSAGMLFGAALGTIVWLSTGEYVFWVVFMGGGMVTGLALGTAGASKER